MPRDNRDKEGGSATKMISRARSSLASFSAETLFSRLPPERDLVLNIPRPSDPPENPVAAGARKAYLQLIRALHPFVLGLRFPYQGV